MTDARLWLLAAAATAYALVRGVEAYGLWFERRWAEWFALVSAGLYVPVEIFELWHEFEAHATPEAKFATALDNLEVQIQHNLADFGTWEPIEYDLVYTKMDARCSHDAFLTVLCNAVKAQAEAKMVGEGVDVTSIRARVAGR